jgi:phenylacetic acid degradation protein
MMPSYELDGVTPVVDPGSFVHPTASLIGDVVIGPECYVGPGASLRGDFGRILVGRGSNVQDNCILHSFPGETTLLEEEAHIGHGAVLHGCTVRRGALIGISAVLMDGVTVEEQAFVGALAFVRAAFTVPKRTLALGSPARVVRELKQEELDWKAIGTRHYQDLARRCLATFRERAPLPAAEPGRPRMVAGDVVPLYQIDRSTPSA